MRFIGTRAVRYRSTMVREVELSSCVQNEESEQERDPLKNPQKDPQTECLISQAFEELLDHVGDGGKYQWWIFLVASFCGLFTAFHSLAAAFLAATPNFHCDFSDLPNASIEAIRTMSGISAESSEWDLPKCEYLDISHFTLLPNTDETIGDNNNTNLSMDKVKCSSWIYDDSIYKSTVVTEWDLVCENEWMVTLAQSTYMAGVLIGAVVLSELSDMYGRRTLALVSSTGLIVTGIATSFSNSFGLFLFMRFLVACFSSGIFLPNFVIVMELAGKKSRTGMGMLYQMFFGVGFCILPAIAYFVRDWKNLQLAISIPSAVLFLYFKLLPESPRWLLSQERVEEAVEILEKIAKGNGRSLPEEKELQSLLSKIHRHEKHSGNIFSKIANFFKNQISLVRTPIMRRRCLIIYFSWFVVSMIYYGLSFSGSNIEASIYLMIFLSGIVEFPAYILAVFTINKFGRKINIVTCFIVCGLACIFILFVPKELVWLNMTFASIGKFFTSAAFAIAFIYSAELVPTKVRNIAVGTSSMWARVGSTLAPFIVDLLGKVHYTIPSTVFGVLSITAGLLDLLLPETGNCPLPETIEEVESLRR